MGHRSIPIFFFYFFLKVHIKYNFKFQHTTVKDKTYKFEVEKNEIYICGFVN